MKKRIIAFGAHHDDIEIRAGGTIAKYVAAGYEVIYAVAVDAASFAADCEYFRENPGKEYFPEEILKIREEESRCGAHILGASEVRFFHLKPAYFRVQSRGLALMAHFNAGEERIIEGMKSYRGKYFCLAAADTPECVAEVIQFIKQHDPEIILTQQINDQHNEHYAVASLVYTACRKLTATGMNLKLYSWQMGSSGPMIRFSPDVIVDISDFMDIKLEAVKTFIKSQVPVDRREEHLNTVLASARYFGQKIGVLYAEPFSEMLIGQRTKGHLTESSAFAEWDGTPGKFKTEL
mgnify:CR=1 FL=1